MFPNWQIIDLSHNEFYGILPNNFFKYLKAVMKVIVDKGKLKYMDNEYYQDSMMVVMKVFFIEMVKIQSLLPLISPTIISKEKFQRQLESFDH